MVGRLWWVGGVGVGVGGGMSVGLRGGVAVVRGGVGGVTRGVAARLRCVCGASAREPAACGLGGRCAVCAEGGPVVREVAWGEWGRLAEGGR